MLLAPVKRALTSLAGRFAVRSLENPKISLNDPKSWSFIFGEASSEAGETVTHKKAIGYAPVRQAVSKISGDVAKIPLGIFRASERDGKTTRDRLKTHPIERRLGKHGMPNDDLNAFKFWRRFMIHGLLWENAYAWIETYQGQIVGVYNLLPDRTTPYEHKGRLYYMTEVSDDKSEGGYRLKALPADQVLHVEGLCLDGLQGSDLVKDFRHDIGIALAARKFTSKFFANNLHAGGILEVPPGTSKMAQEKVEKALEEKHTKGDNAFKTMVLKDGFKWHKTTINPSDAQMVEVDEQQCRHVARMFNLHPSQLGVSESISYNSLEQAKQEYYDGCLSHWLCAIQAEIEMKMLSPGEKNRGVYCEHVINALLWADAQTRNDIACRGIECGRWSPDETRAWENMNPYDGGEVYRVPLNTAPVNDDTAEDEAPEDPVDDQEEEEAPTEGEDDGTQDD